MSDYLLERVSQLMKRNEKKLDAITFSGGEALLHPKLFRYVEKLSNYSDNRTLVTNGLLLDNKMINRILESGITKLRIGVDTIIKQQSRPSRGQHSKKRITDIIELIMSRKIKFELNIVLTKYNFNELEQIISYCVLNKISAKFFELVEVEALGEIGRKAIMHSKETIPYKDFKHIVLQVLGTQRFSDIMGEADVVFEGEGFNLKYCHYLCDYGLCWKTGTRIDAEGSVYTCMNQRGKLFITDIEPIETSIKTISKAVHSGCR